MPCPRSKCCCKGTLTFTLRVCDSSGLLIPGVTIIVKDGGGTTVDSGTTNGSGVYVTGNLKCGPYTWTSSLAGWSGDSGSAAIVTNGSNVAVNSHGMVPLSLHLTDNNASASAMTFISGVWFLCYTKSETGVTMTFDPSLGRCVATSGSISCRISYSVSCNLTQMTQQISMGQDGSACLAGYADCPCGSPSSQCAPAGCFSNSFQTRSSTGAANPLNLSYGTYAGTTFFGFPSLCPSTFVPNNAGASVSVTL